MSAISAVVGPLFDFTEKHGLDEVLVLLMLTLTMPVTEKWEESSCRVGRRLCLKLGSWIMRRT